MNTTPNTFKCTNCGRDGLTDANPWHDCHEDKMRDAHAEITRLNALRNEGRLLAGMGVTPWDRERGAVTTRKAAADLRKLLAGLSIEDLAAIRELDAAAAR